jgi:hypothetical protein
MVDQLKQAVDFMKQVLGDPARTGDPTAVLLPPDPKRSDCVGAHAFAYPNSKAAGLSIYQHVKIAQATLTELVGAGRGCAQRIQGELVNAIGTVPQTPQDVAACARSASAVCAIVNAEVSIDAAFGRVEQSRQEISDALNPAWLSALETSVPSFVTAVTADTERTDDGIQGEIAAIADKGSKGDISGLVAELDALDGALQPVADALGEVDLDDLYDAYDDIAGAVAGVPAFTAGDSSATALLGGIVSQFCADVAGGGPLPAGLQQILDALKITDCSGVSDPAALTDHLLKAVTAINQVKTAVTSMPTRKDVSGSINAATREITTVRADIADAKSALTGDAGSLASALTSLEQHLAALSGTADTINGTLDDITAAQRPGGTIDKALDKAFDGLAAAREDALGPDGTADAQGGTLGAAEQRLAGADASSSRSDVSARVQALVQGMSDVQHDVDDVTDQSARSITASQAGIDKQYGLLTQVLGKNVLGVVRQMDRSLGGSVSSMSAAERTLTDDLKAVLTGIGSPTGTTGLIGAMRDNANRTNDQVLHISTASNEAAAVGARRSVGADQQKLEWQQFSSVISAQASFPAFHLDGLAPDSTTLSVFTFHIGKD